MISMSIIAAFSLGDRYAAETRVLAMTLEHKTEHTSCPVICNTEGGSRKRFS
jgi:hypothetical protein